MPGKIITTVICFLLIFLFVYASVSKLADMKQFTIDMHNQPFPVWMKKTVVPVLPTVELLVAGLLVFDTTRMAGLYASMILMMTFTLYTFLVLVHSFRYIPCSCGGIIKNLTWKQHLLLNLFFLIISITGICIQPVKNIFMHENRTNRKPV